MKRLFPYLLLILCSCIDLHAQEPKAFVLYTSEGKEISYTKMIEKLSGQDVVLFGELHDNPIAHWMELQVAKSLFVQKSQDLVLGAEMFESDDQLILDEYLSGKVRGKNFKEEAKLWHNYKTDYKPLIEFAKTNNLRFIATNIPRRYASMVFHQGPDALKSLDKQAKSYIAPLPIKFDLELKCYKDILEMGGEHANENMPKAQAVKDATMAHFILKNWKKGKTFLHYNGAYHSDNHQSIQWYLEQQNKKLKIMTISSVMQEDISNLEKENFGKADYIFCIPEDMTRTY